MTVLKIRQDRFKGLRDYPFEPNYLFCDKLRIHYIDEGPKDAKPVLLLHGNPTWSYIYRHIITHISKQGYRVIAPDLIGFGKSDKPSSWESINIDTITGWVKTIILSLKLKDVIIYGQDWGAILALKMLANNEADISAIAVSNGIIPMPGVKIPITLKLWTILSRISPWIPVAKIVNLGCRKKLSKEEKRAYKAPFQSSKCLVGIRKLPLLIPYSDNSSWAKLKSCKIPTLTLFSSNDPITRNAENIIINNIPGAYNREHQKFQGGHFLQEDNHIELADAIIRFHKSVQENSKTEYE